VCQPVILVEPVRPDRPKAVALHYKIEDGKEWFALDRAAYTTIRDYIFALEDGLDFTIREIKESNEAQARPGKEGD